MARRIPSDRFDQLVRGAAAVFIERGYRRTQMADVAEAIGVAKGTVYGYVDSKEALFALCLRFADMSGPIPVPELLPLPSPDRGLLGKEVREALAAETRQARLESAIGIEHPPDITAEATEVIGEIFDVMYARRHSIKLLDRCMDHPELSDLWQTAGREGVRVALAEYLAHRAETGEFRTFGNHRLAARFVLETCATWAVHIHWDRAPEIFDDAEARANAIDFAVRGLLA